MAVTLPAVWRSMRCVPRPRRRTGRLRDHARHVGHGRVGPGERGRAGRELRHVVVPQEVVSRHLGAGDPACRPANRGPATAAGEMVRGVLGRLPSARGSVTGRSHDHRCCHARLRRPGGARQGRHDHRAHPVGDACGRGGLPGLLLRRRPSVDTRIQVYELWDDEASLVAHFQHPNYDAMRAALQGQGIVGTANRMFLVARDEPVYGPQGQIRDRFFVDAPVRRRDGRLTRHGRRHRHPRPRGARSGFGQAGRYGPELAVDDDGVPFFRVGTYVMKPMGYRGSVFMDVDKRLRLMDRSGIDRQLLSPNPLTFFHGIDAADAIRVLPRPQRRHGRARGLAPGPVPRRHALPMQDVDASISELTRAVRELGLAAPYVGTDFGFELDDRRLDDLYRTLVELDVPLFLHPASSGRRGPAAPTAACAASTSACWSATPTTRRWRWPRSCSAACSSATPTSTSACPTVAARCRSWSSGSSSPADTRPWVPERPAATAASPRPCAPVVRHPRRRPRAARRPARRHGRHRAAGLRHQLRRLGLGAHAEATDAVRRRPQPATPSGCSGSHRRALRPAPPRPIASYEEAPRAMQPSRPVRPGMLLTNARLFDGTGNEVVADGAVWVDGPHHPARRARRGVRRRARRRARDGTWTGAS